MRYHILFVLLTSSTLFAGKATITGHGRVAAKPDYVSVEITVKSECYPKAKEATHANDVISTRIYDYLKTLVDPKNKQEEVLATGGYTYQFSRPAQVDNVEIIECQGTFAKTSTITLKSTRVKEFELIFDDMQEKVYSEYLGSPKNEEPVTFATIRAPNPSLFGGHKTALKEKAVAMAVANAKAKLNASNSENCQITHMDMVGIKIASEQSFEGEERSFVKPALERAPIEFGLQWEEAYVTIDFEFEGGHCKNLS